MSKPASVLFLFCFSIAPFLNAQTTSSDFWTPVIETNIYPVGKRQIVPLNYQTFELNLRALTEILLSARGEKESTINQSTCIIDIPLPDGRTERFRVVESPVMAPELSASFPQIKTYSVKGLDDVYANGKIDLTEFGFHGMIRTVSGDFFIDPYCVGNTAHYICYYTRDFLKEPQFRMHEDGLNSKEESSSNSKKTGKEKGTGNKAAINCMGDQLRTYRLAVACTHQYAQAATGLSAPTLSQTLAKVVTSINRVDGVYETEVALRMVLVPQTTLVLYTTQAADSFTGNANNNSGQLLGLSQTIITASIGTGNFDIGHTFSTGGGGLASLGCVCNASSKAQGITGSANPVGDPYDIDYVAHEMGHQFGGNHTFNAITGGCNGNRNGATAVEPGSGVTIMAYAGLCSSNNLAGNSIPYFHAISYDEIVNYTTSGGGSGCALTSTTGNQPPVVSGSGTYYIPNATPFILSGSAADPDGDPLTYSWEEVDAGTSGSNWNSGQAPFFRSYNPVTSATRFFPRASVVFNGNYSGTPGEYLPKSAQTLNFRLSARDNKMGGGGVCYEEAQVNVGANGPFEVLYPSDPGIAWGVNRLQTIVWDPASTEQPPISCDSVRIWISYNSGTTYSVLVNSAPNYGWQTITVPNLSATINTCRIKVESIGNIFYDISNNNFTISIDPTVGVSQISPRAASPLSVWPNPANERITLMMNFLSPHHSTEITITDLLGQVLLQYSLKEKAFLKETIEVHDLARGVYLVEVKNSGNRSSQRWIKE